MQYYQDILPSARAASAPNINIVHATITTTKSANHHNNR